MRPCFFRRHRAGEEAKMSVHRSKREFSDRSLDDVVRAFQVDGSWYERHWYGQEEAPTVRGRSMVRRPGVGVMALSLLVVCASVWL
jgi:hypothetical protein